MSQSRKNKFISFFHRKKKNNDAPPIAEKQPPVKTLADLKDVLDAGDLHQARLILDEQAKLLHEKFMQTGEYWSLEGVEEIQVALHDAIVAGKIEIVKMFLEKLPVDTLVKHEVFVLHYVSLVELAAHCGQRDIVKLLIENGAWMDDTKPHNWRLRAGQPYAIHRAAIRAAVNAGHADIVDDLLAYAVSHNKLDDKRKLLAKCDLFLSEAAAKGNHHMVAALIDHGASIPGALAHAFKCYYGSLIYSDYKDAALNDEYIRVVQILLDYASGVNFESNAYDRDDLRYNSLPFLTPIEVMSLRPLETRGYLKSSRQPVLNFIGMTLDDKPITFICPNELGRDYCQPLFHTDDLHFVEDPQRKELLTANTKQFAAEKPTMRK